MNALSASKDREKAIERIVKSLKEKKPSVSTIRDRVGKLIDLYNNHVKKKLIPENVRVQYAQLLGALTKQLMQSNAHGEHDIAHGLHELVHVIHGLENQIHAHSHSDEHKAA